MTFAEQSRPREESLRLFIAIELPEGWLRALADAQQALRRRLEEPAGLRLRWVRPEGIHLTLKFLGSVPASQRAAVQGALAAAVPAPPALRLTLAGAGLFASGRRVRVLWAGVGGDLARLSRLAAAVDTACAAIGFEPERRPFAAHLTLARVAEGSVLDRDAAARALEGLKLEAEPLLVTHVSLMRSHLGPGGARYEQLIVAPA